MSCCSCLDNEQEVPFLPCRLTTCIPSRPCTHFIYRCRCKCTPVCICTRLLYGQVCRVVAQSGSPTKYSTRQEWRRSASSSQPSDISFTLGRDRHSRQRYDHAVLMVLQVDRAHLASTTPRSSKDLALDRPDSDRRIKGSPFRRPPDRLMGAGSLFWVQGPATTGHGSYTSQTSTRINRTSLGQLARRDQNSLAGSAGHEMGRRAGELKADDPFLPPSCRPSWPTSGPALGVKWILP